MASLRIALFGKLRISSDEGDLGNFEAHSKVLELLCYVLLFRDRPHLRESLTDLLWNQSSSARSKKYLRQTLWQLQVTLQAHSQLTGGPLLLIEPEWIQLNPQATFWLDVAAFEQAFDSTKGLRGHEVDRPRAEALQAAVELYQGDLLEGWCQDWCLFERERLQLMYIRMLSKLMAHCEAHRAFELGQSYGLRILRLDRAHEPTHCKLMRLMYLAGDRTAALRQFERCRAALEEELGIEPAASTLALYEQLRADRLAEPSSPTPPRGALVPAYSQPPGTSSSLTSVLTHLRQLETALGQGIQLLESILSGQIDRAG